jgi:hypothetical protein
VQGRLRAGEGLTFVIQSECTHCQRPLRLEMDGAMNYHLDDPAAQPLMFMPDVDWSRFEEPNIIHAY